MATFQVEAEEHLQVLTANLLVLGRELPPSEARKVIEVSFREMHTLKGAARSVGLMNVETLCQACEAVFSKLSHGDLALSPPIVKMLHDAVECVPLLLTGGAESVATKELVVRLKGVTSATVSKATQPIEVPAPQVTTVQTAATGIGSLPSNTIRLDATKLDTLFRQAEELLLSKLAAEMRVQDARALLGTVTRCRAALARGRFSRRSSLGVSQATTAEADSESVMQAMEAQTRVLLDHITHDHRTISSAINGLQENVRLLRMTPVSTILSSFPGMVRSLADELGKQVEWGVRGADLEVDRKVLEAMKDPLIHLVRNAVDHGIESPNVRTKAGKPPQGRVALTITSLEGRRIEIRIEDDGRGVDLAQVRAAAVRGRHLTAEEAQTLTDDEALDLIYRSGISTTSLVSDVSGHGLGLPIVRERVEQLDGHILVETRRAVGTIVRITLPVTIATFRGLLVRAGGQLYVLPSEAVVQATRVPLHHETAGIGRQSMIQWLGQPLPFAQLAKLLGLPNRKDRSEP
ncbi:MAG TPA: ATP-binding protein, partial [Nitrospira sp.]